jgi:hypothetical protein
MVPTLKLVCEHKIRDLLPAQQATERWEASGVLVKDRYYYVVFDDRSQIARIENSLKSDDANGLLGASFSDYGYEGITYNAAKRRFYLLVEARKHAKRRYKALIVEYDDEFRYLKNRHVEFTFECSNKGFEAIAYVEHNANNYLLALCEGNKCKGGKAGKRPGGGRVLLLEKRKKRWLCSRTITLPSSLPFIDFSGMSIAAGRLAIVSQVNSMLWVGQLNDSEWTCSEGELYEFPRSEDGAIQYGNIEGIGWISPTRIVTVSDKRKKTQQRDELTLKDQSVHVFEIPS